MRTPEFALMLQPKRQQFFNTHHTSTSKALCGSALLHRRLTGSIMFLPFLALTLLGRHAHGYITTPSRSLSNGGVTMNRRLSNRSFQHQQRAPPVSTENPIKLDSFDPALAPVGGEPDDYSTSSQPPASEPIIPSPAAVDAAEIGSDDMGKLNKRQRPSQSLVSSYLSRSMSSKGSTNAVYPLEEQGSYIPKKTREQSIPVSSFGGSNSVVSLDRMVNSLYVPVPIQPSGPPPPAAPPAEIARPTLEAVPRAEALPVTVAPRASKADLQTALPPDTTIQFQDNRRATASSSNAANEPQPETPLATEAEPFDSSYSSNKSYKDSTSAVYSLEEQGSYTPKKTRDQSIPVSSFGGSNSVAIFSNTTVADALDTASSRNMSSEDSANAVYSLEQQGSYIPKKTRDQSIPVSSFGGSNSVIVSNTATGTGAEAPPPPKIQDDRTVATSKGTTSQAPLPPVMIPFQNERTVTDTKTAEAQKQTALPPYSLKEQGSNTPEKTMGQSTLNSMYAAPTNDSSAMAQTESGSTWEQPTLSTNNESAAAGAAPQPIELLSDEEPPAFIASPKLQQDESFARTDQAQSYGTDRSSWENARKQGVESSLPAAVIVPATSSIPGVGAVSKSYGVSKSIQQSQPFGGGGSHADRIALSGSSSSSSPPAPAETIQLVSAPPAENVSPIVESASGAIVPDPLTSSIPGVGAVSKSYSMAKTSKQSRPFGGGVSYLGAMASSSSSESSSPEAPVESSQSASTSQSQPFGGGGYLDSMASTSSSTMNAPVPAAVTPTEPTPSPARRTATDAEMNSPAASTPFTSSIPSGGAVSKSYGMAKTTKQTRPFGGGGYLDSMASTSTTNPPAPPEVTRTESTPPPPAQSTAPGFEMSSPDARTPPFTSSIPSSSAASKSFGMVKTFKQSQPFGGGGYLDSMASTSRPTNPPKATSTESTPPPTQNTAPSIETTSRDARAPFTSPLSSSGAVGKSYGMAKSFKQSQPFGGGGSYLDGMASSSTSSSPPAPVETTETEPAITPPSGNVASTRTSSTGSIPGGGAVSKSYGITKSTKQSQPFGGGGSYLDGMTSSSMSSSPPAPVKTSSTEPTIAPPLENVASTSGPFTGSTPGSGAVSKSYGMAKSSKQSQPFGTGGYLDGMASNSNKANSPAPVETSQPKAPLSTPPGDITDPAAIESPASVSSASSIRSVVSNRAYGISDAQLGSTASEDARIQATIAEASKSGTLKAVSLVEKAKQVVERAKQELERRLPVEKVETKTRSNQSPPDLDGMTARDSQWRASAPIKGSDQSTVRRTPRAIPAVDSIPSEAFEPTTSAVPVPATDTLQPKELSGPELSPSVPTREDSAIDSDTLLGNAQSTGKVPTFPDDAKTQAMPEEEKPTAEPLANTVKNSPEPTPSTVPVPSTDDATDTLEPVELSGPERSPSATTREKAAIDSDTFPGNAQPTGKVLTSSNDVKTQDMPEKEAVSEKPTAEPLANTAKNFAEMYQQETNRSKRNERQRVERLQELETEKLEALLEEARIAAAKETAEKEAELAAQRADLERQAADLAKLAEKQAREYEERQAADLAKLAEKQALESEERQAASFAKLSEKQARDGETQKSMAPGIVDAEGGLTGISNLFNSLVRKNAKPEDAASKEAEQLKPFPPSEERPVGGPDATDENDQTESALQRFSSLFGSLISKESSEKQGSDQKNTANKQPPSVAEQEGGPLVAEDEDGPTESRIPSFSSILGRFVPKREPDKEDSFGLSKERGSPSFVDEKQKLKRPESVSVETEIINGPIVQGGSRGLTSIFGGSFPKAGKVKQEQSSLSTIEETTQSKKPLLSFKEKRKRPDSDDGPVGDKGADDPTGSGSRSLFGKSRPKSETVKQDSDGVSKETEKRQRFSLWSGRSAFDSNETPSSSSETRRGSKALPKQGSNATNFFGVQRNKAPGIEPVVKETELTTDQLKSLALTSFPIIVLLLIAFLDR